MTEITPLELKQRLLTELGKKGLEKIHPLHDAMIDECCENALKNLGQPDNIYSLSVMIGFITANAALRGILLAS